MLHTLRFSLQNAIYLIILPFLFPVLFTFYIQGVLKFKFKTPVPKGSAKKEKEKNNYRQEFNIPNTDYNTAICRVRLWEADSLSFLLVLASRNTD
jgi:hypothetical protein